MSQPMSLSCISPDSISRGMDDRQAGISCIEQSITLNVPTFAELYENAEYRNYVRVRILTMLHSRPDWIDDAIQETWIKVWRSLPRITSTHNLKGWLWLVATTTVYDAMRRYKTWDKHHQSLEAIFDLFDISPDEYRNCIMPDPHDYIPEQVERYEQRQRIWSRLLPQDQQTFLAVVKEEPFERKDYYYARRRYKRAVEREKREVAS
jgi:RNA polymerase sigma factor (sigma-70 family)